MILGVVYDSWKEVPDAKKEDIWNTSLQKFIMQPYHRDNALKQVEDQWKTWKKNIRGKYFGTAR